MALAVMLGIFLFSSTGCATTGKKAALENDSLKNQISVLETQVKAKDEEIACLKDSLARTQQATLDSTSKKQLVAEIKSRPKAKMIQIALKNAGYDPGVIDGQMGKSTIDAVKAFQKANNLPVDGKVGKRTWKALRPFLVEKVK